MDSTECDNLPSFADLEKKDQEINYEVWTVTEVAEYINFLTKRLSGTVFGISSQLFKCLLDRYNWNTYQLSYDLMHNRKSVFKNAKIKDPVKKSNKMVQKIKKKFKKYMEDNHRCKLCNDVLFHDSSVVHCKHNYCKHCWSLSINSKYSLEEAITCPENKCLVAYDTVMHYLKISRILHFQHSTISSFVKNDPSLSWCPKSNSCSFLIKVMNSNVKKVSCNCGTMFCFDCKQEWHTPIPCKMLQCWKKIRKAQIESKNSKNCPKCTLIIKLTDECPKCSSEMEIKKKLFTDPFYNFSELYRLYELEDEFQRMFKLSKNYGEDSQKVISVMHTLGELRGIYKCCIVFLYFLRRNNHHAEVFCCNFVLYRKIMNNLIGLIRKFYEADSKENSQNVINFAKVGYKMAFKLESACKDGFKNMWWNFKAIDLNNVF